MSQRIGTRSQQRRDETGARRTANTWGTKYKKPKPLDLRGHALHDGTKEKKNLSYVDYLKSRHWSIVRKLALKATNSRCSNCDNNRDLNVHHLTYENLWHEYANDVTVLCNTCHNMLHGLYIHPAANLSA